jgi:hypothetical protein
MGALMIVLPAHARNFANFVRACGERCTEKRYSSKNQNADDWLANVDGACRIDVLVGNR